MSMLRCQCSSLARRLPTTTARSFSSSAAIRADATTTAGAGAPAANVGSVKPPKQPVGGFRGGIVGFLLGFSIASSFAAYHLLEEYKQASAALQASVLELQASTEKVTAHIRRIEAVEKDLKALSNTTATKDDLSRVRAEMKKIYDGLDIEFLNLRQHVWGIQQDLHALTKKDNATHLV
ncbi:uncharacterized protein FOMMEDRAFT_128504 [Fomitiporia mediterranea MF3/22]|uniref:uncharacterized protein n=1 Tax=Fomitiporia mediterranea (strain MF3/22) TaxID=694068 RepID=UPI00044091B7|nr:uncharacterized protein FOMMEDRAFT_128504 [Fomitiporia mediterranea MF3/22]EJC98841.1 hypothetical protein FOMMEDRAFT_128504 [Fomitiporia mediterranea MF3/22]